MEGDELKSGRFNERDEKLEEKLCSTFFARDREFLPDSIEMLEIQVRQFYRKMVFPLNCDETNPFWSRMVAKWLMMKANGQIPERTRRPEFVI